MPLQSFPKATEFRLASLLAGCCGAAILMPGAAALAQAADETPLEEIVVRGTARNYADSIGGKRRADGIVDLFDTDEVGRLPDKNIGETLNRIPGVSMLLEKGEGRFVQIRGLSPRLNNVTINGVSLGGLETDEGGRAVPLDAVGGELLGGVQIIKTRTPDMDGQGIGGTLDLKTKQPFDYEEDFTMLLTGRAGIETIDAIEPADTKEIPWTADLTLAGKFADGKLGWLAGASFSNRKTPLPGIFQDDWRPVTFDPDPDVAGDEETIAFPENFKNNVTVVGRERLNLNGMIEFRPDDSQRYFVRGFFARWDELQLRNRFEQGLSDRLTAVDGEDGGTISGNRVQVNIRSEPTDKELFSVALGGENVAGPWTVDYLGQRNRNRIDEPNNLYEFRSGATTFGPDDFTIRPSGVVIVRSDGADRQDPSLQTFRRARFEEKRGDEEGYIAAINLRRDFEIEGFGETYLKFGGKWTRTEREEDRSRPTFNVGSEPWTLAFDPSFNRGGFTNPVPIEAQPNLWIDIDALDRFFAANRDDPRFFRLDEPDAFLNEFQSDFDLRERVIAGYVMGKAEFGIASLIAGVRIEDTDVRSSAFTIVNEDGESVARPISGEGGYTNVLPSVIGTVDLREDVIVRAAYTKSIGRPEFDVLAPRSALDIELDPTVGTIGTLSIGNPDLKARSSNNLDLSLEWYFDEGSLLAIALFYKDISNEIVPAPEQRLENFTFEGQTFDRFEIATTVNARSAEVKGIEITLADRFDFLPAPFDGLGFAGSVTFLDSEVEIERGGAIETLPLLEQADRSLNLTLYWQKGRWDISGTFNHNRNFLTDFGATRALDLDQGGVGRFDTRVQYNVTDNIKLFFDGINLNNEPTSEFQGGVKRQKTEFEFTGRTLFFGATARF